MANSEMVERVARALKGFVAGEILETGCINGDRWGGMARAAIAAMREPTDAMVAAGDQAGPAAEGFGLPDDMPDVWRAMIDEALK